MSVSGRSSFDFNSSIEEEGSTTSKERRISRASFQASVSREESDDEYSKTESHRVHLVGGQGVGKTEILYKLLSSDNMNCQDIEKGNS